MSPEQIMNAIDQLQADAARISAALHVHTTKQPPGSADHARLHRLFTVLSDLHLMLLTTPRPAWKA
jgi:hypothetical protein